MHSGILLRGPPRTATTKSAALYPTSCIIVISDVADRWSFGIVVEAMDSMATATSKSAALYLAS